jgi:hypothetical protein
MMKQKQASSARRLSKWRRFAIAVALAIASQLTAPDRADAGAAIMDFPLSVRSVGMGESGVSDRTDPGNAYLNPANITAVNGIYSTGSYRVLWPQLGNENSLGHVSLGFGRSLKRKKPFRLAFDLTYARLKFSDQQKESYVALTAGMNVATGQHTELALGLAFKHWWAKDEFTHPIFVPGGTDYTGGESSANLFDVGAVVTVNLDASGWRVRPMVGLALVNMGSDIEHHYRSSSLSPPSWFKYGVTAQVESPHVTLRTASVPTITATLNVQGNHGLEEQRPFWGIGAEIAVVQAIFVRWGRHVDDHSHDPTSMWGAAVGIPKGRALLRFEYANSVRPEAWFASNVDNFGFTFVWLFDSE